jgi:hypothetical protein
MITRPELARRMSEVPHADFVRALRMVREGYSAHGITLESPLTLKQANAAFDWVSRYGGILPNPGECQQHTVPQS